MLEELAESFEINAAIGINKPIGLAAEFVAQTFARNQLIAFDDILTNRIAALDHILARVCIAETRGQCKNQSRGPLTDQELLKAVEIDAAVVADKRTRILTKDGP